MYNKLSESASVAFARDIWEAKIPLKIRIFTWQLVLDRLPSSLLISSRHGPATGRCALCNSPENADHIFFSCSLARFLWSVVRQLLECRWSPSSFAQFFAIVSCYSGRQRRLIWTLFAAQSWTLWNIRNKLAIEGKLIGNPADIFYQLSLHMQCWRVLVRPRDRDLLDLAVGGVRRLYARTRSEST
jgi:hypothetical protein